MDLISITAQSQAQSRRPLRSTLWAAAICETSPAPGTAQGATLRSNISHKRRTSFWTQKNADFADSKKRESAFFCVNQRLDLISDKV